LILIGQALHGLVVEHSIREVGDIGEGLRVVCIREQLKDLKENAKLLIEDELQEFGVSSR
jgi:phage terminase large subunit